MIDVESSQARYVYKKEIKEIRRRRMFNICNDG